MQSFWRCTSPITTSAKLIWQSDAHRQWPLALSKANGALRNWLNAVANNDDYIERLKSVILHLHGCQAFHADTVPVHESFQGETVWQGDVEIFDLKGHAKAKRCYAWSYGEPEQFITILALPPVKSAQDAVKVGVSYQIKKSKK